jgi:lysophospholipase L1-like esterase
MHQVLVYGDSLSWGMIPNTRNRLPFDERWPGVLENNLLRSGLRIRVMEDCLNGRRSTWDDPFKPGRNGREGLAQSIERHSPLSLVVLMIGTNDFQFCHPFTNAWSAAQGIANLVNEVRKAPTEPGMPMPRILIASPPRIGSPKGAFLEKFRGAENRDIGLPEAHAQIALELGCDFFDANTVITSSVVDGVHLDADQHLELGLALTQVVRAILF